VGECVATYYLSCSDGNPCSVDACDPKTGCDFHVNVANQTPCDDLDVCTNETTCNAGVCGKGTPIVCADDNACTSESCDSTLGCIIANVPDGPAWVRRPSALGRAPTGAGSRSAAPVARSTRHRPDE